MIDKSSYPFRSKLNWLPHPVSGGIARDLQGGKPRLCELPCGERNREEENHPCYQRPGQKSDRRYRRHGLLSPSWGLEKHGYGSLVVY